MEKNYTAVIEEGVREVAKRNGEGSGRYYHGPKHTNMVMGCVRMLARMAGLSEHYILLLVIAAAWHDVEQSLGPGKNEQESGRLMGESMRRNGFTEAEIMIPQMAIEGTKVWFDGNGVMHQEAEKMGLIEKLLADADLCNIGADAKDYLEMATRLMREVCSNPVMGWDDVGKGWQNQVKFMTNRVFLTHDAQRFMDTHLERNLLLATSLAKGYMSK